MKTWKQRTAWLRLVVNVLLVAIVSSFGTAPTLTRQAIKPVISLTTVQATGNYTTEVFTDAQKMKMIYYLFIPIDYDPHIKYPLVLLLHGGDERASIGNPVNQNRDALLNQNYVKIWGPGIPGPNSFDVQAHYPSFIVVPQADYPQRWVDIPTNQGSYTLTAQPTDSLRMAKEIVDALQKKYPNIDPLRLYITGLSMGGYGTWDAIERWPNYFAAAAPLAGAGDPSKASRLVNLPIWAFHGSGDGDVPVTGSRDMIQSIKLAGGHPRYTEYASAGHDIWMMVYSSPGFISWLFSQRASYPQLGSIPCSGQPTTWSLLRMLEIWLHTLLGLKGDVGIGLGLGDHGAYFFVYHREKPHHFTCSLGPVLRYVSQMTRAQPMNPPGLGHGL